MKIVINGRFLTRRPTGVDRFAYEVCKAIDTLLTEESEKIKNYNFRIIVPSGEKINNKFNKIEIKEYGGGVKGQLWEQFCLPMALKKGEILLNLCNTAPMFLRNQSVVIHDATPKAFPTTFSLGFRLWYSILIPIIGNFSKSVLTVSNFSKGEISKRYYVNKEKISVVSESGEHILNNECDGSILSENYLDKNKYVLAVSSQAEHKNFSLILDSLRHVGNKNIKVAIAGGANSKVFAKKYSDIVSSENVIWLGYVTDNELRSLYENCLCFVFPSFYEGFGIPPLEAMSCGAPVLVSNASSLPEVCGNAAKYLNPNDPIALASLIDNVSDNDALRDEMITKSKQHAVKFSWKKASETILEECLKIHYKAVK